MTYIVNGEEVDLLEIKETDKGTEITYKKRFNVAKATQREIHDRLTKNNIKCHPSIYKKQKIIILYLNSIYDAHAVIDCLKLHQNHYEIDREQCLITVDI